MRSNRSCSRARTGERGFALVWAVGLALLFFMLIQLVLLDSSRELSEARRFRARILAINLAENGAELSAVHMRDHIRGVGSHEDWQGAISGEFQKNPQTGEFTMWGEGVTRGTVQAKARVDVKGRYVAAANRIEIDYTIHTP